MTDPSTEQPLTRRQRRELEAAGLSAPSPSSAAVRPPIDASHPFEQFFTVNASERTGSEPTVAAVQHSRVEHAVPIDAAASSVASDPASLGSAVVPALPSPSTTHAESVELPPFVATAYPKRTGGPVRKRRLTAREKSRLRAAAARSPRSALVSSRLFSMVAMLFAGALLVGVSVPANAIMGPVADPEALAETEFVPGQALAVSSDVVAAAASPKRELPTVTSYAEQLRERYGNRSYTYKATTGAIRWPFAYAVPITDGYGERVAPCRGCSTFHQGVDFTPGDGTPITAIAAGTVVFTEVTNSGIGNQVRIEHLIGNSKITSVYAGMQMNSSPMKVGDLVKVGDFVGLVGATGVATGPHLHFELMVSEIKVDPFAWLTKNATNAG
ncbi:M23 family metallopeptidase [Glaciihabitans arcticus]|uniref:M23 family metallopeptidase n=1 Tax=Glaciihabitans arcticus TaxID=2668039 RepID=A0A4Q9H164_9MICO|nr:M23 family metallopeptidase [Glaciihabitans arcticus]TBN58460.1 M23 family metallopeptidase [Glaciihabitans arcticus]